MTYQLTPFANVGLDESLLYHLIEEHEAITIPEYERYWSYYRNPASHVEVSDSHGTRWEWRSAQAEGLPPRLKHSDVNSARKEIVITNEIAWRLQVIVDYIAGREIKVVSTTNDPKRRAQINHILEAVFENVGGLSFVQDLVLLGCIYGHTDLLLRAKGVTGREREDEKGLGEELPVNAPSNPNVPKNIIHGISQLSIETIEAPRAIPLLNPYNYRIIDAYILRYQRLLNKVDSGTFLKRLGSWTGLSFTQPYRERETSEVTEIFSPDHHQVYEDENLVHDEHNKLGVLPLIHIQDTTQPYSYEGISEVEGLISLQDELNTRLSDRANRFTLQSFKMYLGKGIDGFGEKSVRPGQMWMTDNPDASIQEFGGDLNCTSEDSHINDIRVAMDKVSSVTALAAGVIQGHVKVGTLSSENALRISLLGILSKVERKRKLYGHGLSKAFELVLKVLDHEGIFHTRPEERCCEIIWTAPVPEDQSKRLADALIKRDLGVPRDRILAELGYGTEELLTLDNDVQEQNL